MRTTTLRQKAVISAPPDQVYRALMSSLEHSEFTGSDCNIGTRKGSRYSVYDGYITGKNLELVKGKRIVQTWIAKEEEWPEGHESKVIFELKPKGKKTEINFTHEGLPVSIAKRFVSGWKDYYWKPMQQYFKMRYQE